MGALALAGKGGDANWRHDDELAVYSRGLDSDTCSDAQNRIDKGIYSACFVPHRSLWQPWLHQGANGESF